MRLAISFLLFVLQFTSSAQTLSNFGNNQHDSTVNAVVNDAAIFNGKLYLGGSFALINGVAVNSLCSYDGTTTAQIGALNANVLDLEIFNNKLFVAYTGVTSGVAFWNDTALQYTAFSGLTDSYVFALQAHNGSLYVSGCFKVNNQYYVLAQYDGTSWSYHGTCTISKAGALDMAIFNNDILLGGAFDTVNGISFGKSIIRFDGSSFLSYSSPLGICTSLLIEGNSVIEGLRKQPANLSPFANSNGTSFSYLSDTIFAEADAGRVFQTSGLHFYAAAKQRDNIMGESFAAGVLYLKQGQNYVPLTDSIYGTETPYLIKELPEDILRGVIKFQNQWIVYGAFKSTSALAIYPQNILAVIGSVLGEEETALAKPATLYPNPTKGFLFFEDVSSNESYTILNLQGETLKTGKLTSTLNTSNLPAGVYIFLREGKHPAWRQCFIKLD